MKVSDFDFELPPERIALRPADPRDSARMLVVRGSDIDDQGVDDQSTQDQSTQDQRIRDLPGYLHAGDILVLNDTRVIPARLKGKRGEAGIEVTLHQKVEDAGEFQSENEVWRAFARPAKKCRLGDVINFGALGAEVLERGEGGEITLGFDKGGAAFQAALAEAGVMPLPPYIASKRPPDARDLTDYQTMFATSDGAVAAPTAGLHFTEALAASLAAKGVLIVRLTLHVGAGTFLPVKVDDTDDHKMHSEWGEITPDAADKLNVARAAGGRIVAVGTTSLRLLESAADEGGLIHAFSAPTDIFITPGYRFRAVDVLLTNFHLPKSTLFMLVSAFSGLGTMQRAYAHAIAAGYRYYSYGDACLLFPQGVDD